MEKFVKNQGYISLYNIMTLLTFSSETLATDDWFHSEVQKLIREHLNNHDELVVGMEKLQEELRRRYREILNYYYPPAPCEQ